MLADDDPQSAFVQGFPSLWNDLNRMYATMGGELAMLKRTLSC